MIITLTDEELGYERAANINTREVYALEHYSRLWDSLDRRVGKGNDQTKAYVAEYKARIFDHPLDEAEHNRVQFMRASFYLPRTDMPPEVIAALIQYSINK